MLNQLRNFLSRSPQPPANRASGPACKHPYCAHLTYCHKLIGEETLSQSGLSEVHSLNTLISDHFDAVHESDYAWDSDYGWGEFCHRCLEERCQDCGTKIFTSVTNFEDVLTFENMEVWICAPCKHGMCPGWKVKILSLCGGCAHVACRECILDGNGEKGMVCCQCGEGGWSLSNNVEKEQSKDIQKSQIGEEVDCS
jgi:hypothetical protein